MDIVKENTDKLTAVLKISVTREDFEPKVEDVLKDYRRKAQLKGFRQGKAPMGIIKKMYYAPVVADEVNKLVSESLFEYIRNEDIRILGEPLPVKDEEKTIDFEQDDQFDFEFEIGLSPEVKTEVNEKDKYPYYNLKIEKKQVDEYKDSVAKRYGEFISVEHAGDDELIKCILAKVDKDGNEVENGIYTEDVSMSLDMMKDADQKLLFKGTKKGAEVIFDVKKAFPNDTEVASMLRIDKDEIPLIDGAFKCIITDIQKFEKAKIDQDLFDKIYGEGTVKSAEEFEAKLKEEMKGQYEQDSEYRFAVDVRETLLKKAKLDLPVDFLKRWLLETNENLTQEQIDQDFNQYEDDFRWQLIKDHLVKKYEIQVTPDEVKEAARDAARSQYYQYGITDIPEEYLDNFANEMLSKKEEARRITERKLEEKLINFIKNTVKIDDKQITVEKFRKLFDSK